MEEETVEDSILQAVRKPQRVFPLHRVIKQMILDEWDLPEAGLKGSHTVAQLYPLLDQEKEMFCSLKVDAAVLAVTKKTTVPVESSTGS